MQSWPNKDPDEVLDYQFDWASRLVTSETISTSTFVVTEGSVTMANPGILAGKTTVWLSGGTLGEVNIITNRVETNQGRVYEESARLRIRSH